LSLEPPPLAIDAPPEPALPTSPAEPELVALAPAALVAAPPESLAPAAPASDFALLEQASESTAHVSSKRVVIGFDATRARDQKARIPARRMHKF
jgi:hypothetical protein